MPNLLTPDAVIAIPKATVDEQIPSQISPMPEGLLNVLTREEIRALLAFLEAGEDLPEAFSSHGHQQAR